MSAADTLCLSLLEEFVVIFPLCRLDETAERFFLLSSLQPVSAIRVSRDHSGVAPYYRSSPISKIYAITNFGGALVLHKWVEHSAKVICYSQTPVGVLCQVSDIPFSFSASLFYCSLDLAIPLR